MKSETLHNSISEPQLSEDHQCPICLDVYYTPVKLSTCNHIFCRSCIDQGTVISNDRRCPLCRASFKGNNIKEEKEMWEMIRNRYPLQVQARKKFITERVMVSFLIGNTTKVLGVQQDNNYEWCLFVESAENSPCLSELTDLIEVELHPTFNPRKLKYHYKAGHPINLKRIGWGTFEIGVKIYWKKQFNQRVSEFSHHLQFVPRVDRHITTALTLKK